MRRRGAMAWAALPLVLSACGPDGSTADPDPSPAASWRTSSDPVAADGLIWATGPTVHLPDGTTIDTDSPTAVYVVAGDGVFFVPDADGNGRAADEEELHFAAPDGTVTGTGIVILTETLSASPDGRYVGALDMASGEKDHYGTPQAIARVFDLESGEEVVHSSEGMGDPDEDDLAALYPELDPLGFAALTNQTAYVDGAGETYAHDLETGDGERLPEGEEPPVRDPSSLASPDGSWQIVETKKYADRLVSRDGREVAPQPGTPRWNLEWWADDQTVVGWAISGPGRGARIDPRDSLALMSCAVPSGRCQVFEETPGQPLRFPVGATEATAMTPQAGSGNAR